MRMPRNTALCPGRSLRAAIRTGWPWLDAADLLEKLNAERDAAVKDISEIIGDIEEIRRGYGVDNADADNAFAYLCGNYCSNNSHRCYEESETYRCKHFKWRGLEGRNA